MDKIYLHVNEFESSCGRNPDNIVNITNFTFESEKELMQFINSFKKYVDNPECFSFEIEFEER